MLENRYLLTGGHAATTAIAVINELRRRNARVELFWVGPKSAIEGKDVATLASKIMPELGVKYVPIIAGRVQRKFTVWTIPALFKIPIGFINAFKILREIKPSAIISFGGYASVPVCIVGWLDGIPVIVHEQTVAVGRASRVVAPFARKILIAREESRKYFPKGKTVVIGNPVSREVGKVKTKSQTGKIPVIYVTGGSSGAQKINEAVAGALYDLLKKYKLIHQTGQIDYEEFREKRETFPEDLRAKYEVYDFINPSSIPKVFEEADIVVSRAGANTISEIMATRRPSILIPISWSAYDEQTKNAKLAESTGIAVVLAEDKLTPESLIEKIEYIFRNWRKMVANFDPKYAEIDKQAAAKFVDEIESL